MKYSMYQGQIKEQKTINKIFLAAVVSLVAVLSITATTLAAGPYNAIPDSNPVFTDSSWSSRMNENNPALRFGSGGRIAIPGNGAGNANENSAVAPWSTGGSGGIVDPRGAF